MNIIHCHVVIHQGIGESLNVMQFGIFLSLAVSGLLSRYMSADSAKADGADICQCCDLRAAKLPGLEQYFVLHAETIKWESL